MISTARIIEARILLISKPDMIKDHI